MPLVHTLWLHPDDPDELLGTGKWRGEMDAPACAAATAALPHAALSGASGNPHKAEESPQGRLSSWCDPLTLDTQARGAWLGHRTPAGLLPTCSKHTWPWKTQLTGYPRTAAAPPLRKVLGTIRDQFLLPRAKAAAQDLAGCGCLASSFQEVGDCF